MKSAAACSLQRVRRPPYSHGLSVRPSVTFRCFVQTNEDTIMRFSASGRTITLVSREIKFIPIFAGGHPSKGVKVILRYFAEFDSFRAHYVKVVEDIPYFL